MGNIRIAIMSENPYSRNCLSAIFSSESAFNVLGSFPLAEINDKASFFQPDVILFDVFDDEKKYIEEIKQLKNNCAFTLVFALLEKKHCESIYEEMLKYVDSCIQKGITRGCLVKAVELACIAGLFYIPASLKKMISFIETDEELTNNYVMKGNLANGNTLTRREMEILQLIAISLSNREIAKRLFISEPTVKTHVSNILRKLGQQNRSQAIVYSYKNGLITNCI
ncbi:transcriptional regulator, LuxR family [Desulfofarcimen acetoxidans DSM 771]|uniref:Transcriptional regulator, LuxR family n=1 Tax=Desulfofarcimen acetoxidans (strain ATCC 49208 / DSM 771 / KCTC 5769 / VKM B-1644 / 5575) TaxID=485916 RepID=C8W5L1_DESAS|nr:response regulator transcription factor [Desulfofarcimen acetoxidans]ACV64011.1 transcriptional regulator, LuxR family [Desulfofarcimen acetoxidans DSM 771]